MSDRCELLLIRHAETDMAGKFCGGSNPPVNTHGHEQIQTLLRTMEGCRIEAVYTSDLLRARTTADALSEPRGLTPIELPALREIDFGTWEGCTWSEIERRDPAESQQWLTEFPNLPAPGGERFDTFQSRVLTAVSQILQCTQHRCAAVVTHAGVMRVVLTKLCGVDEPEAWQLTQAYCSVFAYPYSIDGATEGISQ